MLYAHEFFRTKEEARAFQRERGGGALYSNLPGSRTRKAYTAEACMAELTEKQREEKPFCVAWNVVDDGPIVKDEVILEPEPADCENCTDKGHCPEYVAGAECVTRRGRRKK